MHQGKSTQTHYFVCLQSKYFNVPALLKRQILMNIYIWMSTATPW